MQDETCETNLFRLSYVACWVVNRQCVFAARTIRKETTVYLNQQMQDRGGGELAHARYRHMTHCLVKHRITGHLVFVLVTTE
jgi:hypothetical protein